MPDRNYQFAIDPQNIMGKQVLASDLDLYAYVPKSRNSTEKERVWIGFAQNANVDESRTINYNYVIGNSDPSTPRDLIPGPIQQSTIMLSCLVYHKLNPIGLFSNNKPEDEAVSGSRLASSIRYQTRPFDIVETWKNPTNGKVVYTQTYKDCYIESAGHTSDYNSSNLSVTTDVKIHFKTTVIEINKSEINNPSLGNLVI